MVPTLDLPLLVMASVLGGLLGFVTGLVPGLHSNNVAALAGASPALVLGMLTMGALHVPEDELVQVASCLVVACAVAHTVTNIVPSVYLAVPEGDTALSVLPGHRMVMAGRGDEALRVSVAGSLVSLALALALVVPMTLAMTRGMHGVLRPYWGPVLLGISSVLIAKEWLKDGRRGGLGGWRASAAALAVFMSSGVVGGLAMFRGDHMAPMFMGLFGVPMLLVALMYPARAPPLQGSTGEGRRRRLPLAPVVKGSLAGGLVGWFPGVSSAQATVLAVVGEVDDGDDLEGARRFVAGVSAVNTANAVFAVVALTALLRVRSGTAAAVGGLMGWQVAPWSEGVLPGIQVTALLLAAGVGGLLAAPLTLLAGRAFQRLLPILSDGWALVGILLVLALMASRSGGPVALVVLATASALGTVPPLLGLMRVHLMGAVTLPLALTWLAG